MSNKLETLFIDTELPNPLNKSETRILFEKYHNGNMTARTEIIMHNIKLVLYIIMKHFYDTRLDKRELVSHGLIGLIKAVDSFSIDKEIDFVTYAHKCIYNEVLQTAKKEINQSNIYSLDETENNYIEKTMYGASTNDIELIDEQNHNKLIFKSVLEIIDKLNDQDKDLIISFFGLYDTPKMTQKELGLKYKMAQSHVALRIKKILTEIKFELQLQELIDYDNNVDEFIEKKLPKNFYNLFPTNTTQEINYILGKCSEEEINLLKIRHGQKLTKLTKDYTWKNTETKEKYLRLVSNIKRKLEYAFPESKNIDIFSESFTMEDAKILDNIIKEKEFIEKHKNLSLEEIKIGLLKTGAINGKYFKIEVIAKIFGVDNYTVRLATIKYLNSIKNNYINQNEEKKLLIS